MCVPFGPAVSLLGICAKTLTYVPKEIPYRYMRGRKIAGTPNVHECRMA